MLNYAFLASRLTNISELKDVWFDVKSQTKAIEFQWVESELSCMVDISHFFTSHSHLPPTLAQTSAFH